MAFARLLLVGLMGAAAWSSTAAEAQNADATSGKASYSRYVIVGAGPGGLQLAHYLHSAGRDYVVLEKHDIPASFFRRFPRFRQLISINKWSTGRSELEFNQRHDWNSLLSEPSPASEWAAGDVFNRTFVPCLRYDSQTRGVVVDRARACASSDFSGTDSRFTVKDVAPGLQMRDYTRVYFPDADKLVEYMAFFASEKAARGAITGKGSKAYDQPREPLNIRFNSDVSRISRVSATNDGLKAVGGGAPRFRIHTRNGDVIDCTFLIIAGGMQKLNRAEGINVAEMADNYWTASTNLEDYVDKHVLILGRGNGAFEFAKNVLEVAASVHLLGRPEKRVSPSWESHYPGDVRMVHAQLLESYLLKSMDAMAEVPMEHLEIHTDNVTGKYYIEDSRQPCTKDSFGRDFARCFFRKQYDKIISIPGWHFDASIFDADIRPTAHSNKKHPAINGRYESINVPGVFFAGTLMHAHDFKKSSGGFIHGFRYLVRALHRVLEEDEQAAAESMGPGRSRNHPSSGAAVVGARGSVKATTAPPAPFISWPRRTINGLRAALSTIMRRINNAAAMYQMFGSVSDVLVLPPMTAKTAEGFVSAGVRAATVDPGTFYDPKIFDVYLPQYAPQLPQGHKLDLSRLHSDEAINRALVGAYFEDVPVPLVAEKAPLWSAQTAFGLQAGDFDAGDITTHGAVTSTGGGYEYLVLTLEFGRGSSSNPDLSTASPGAIPGVEQWARDPFSLLRANVSLANPEDSHFLHPVLRYYNTRLHADKPVLECHVIEDFHTNWTHYVAHILPIARCLEDVGARRAQAALAMQSALGSSRTAAKQPSSGDVKIARDVLRKVWMVRREGNVHESLLRQHMMLAVTDLWYGGVPVSGGEGWTNFLTVNSTDHLFHRGPRMLLIHFVDTNPVPPTDEERADWQYIRELMESGPDGHMAAMEWARMPPRQISMTDEERRNKESNEAYLRRFYAELTYTKPGLAIVSINARTPLGRIHAEQNGVKDVPVFRVVDQWRGTMDLPGDEFEKIADNIEYLLSTHFESFVALKNDDDSYLFPGFTVDMLKSMSPPAAGAANPPQSDAFPPPERHLEDGNPSHQHRQQQQRHDAPQQHSTGRTRRGAASSSKGKNTIN